MSSASLPTKDIRISPGKILLNISISFHLQQTRKLQAPFHSTSRLFHLFQQTRPTTSSSFPLYLEISVLSTNSTMKLISILFVSLPALGLTMAGAIPEPLRVEIAMKDDGNIDRSSQRDWILNHADQYGFTRIAKIFTSSDKGELSVVLPQSPLDKHTQRWTSWYPMQSCW